MDFKVVGPTGGFEFVIRAESWMDGKRYVERSAYADCKLELIATGILQPSIELRWNGTDYVKHGGRRLQVRKFSTSTNRWMDWEDVET